MNELNVACAKVWTDRVYSDLWLCASQWHRLCNCIRSRNNPLDQSNWHEKKNCDKMSKSTNFILFYLTISHLIGSFA